MNKRNLQLQHLNRNMGQYASLKSVAVPYGGWIKAIRQALGMSGQQLARKMSMSRQAVQDMEKREQEGNITIKSLREAGKAMNLKLVYALVPDADNLHDLIEARAKELATEIVSRTAGSMVLEDQANHKSRIRKAIRERTDALVKEMPKRLWD